MSPSVLMIDASDRGGIARYTEHLVRDLRASGLDVALCAPGDRAVDAPALPARPWGHEVDGWSRSRRRVVGVVSWVRRAATVHTLVRRTRPDVVHLQTPVAGPLDRTLLRWINRRAVVVRTIHNVVAHDDSRTGRRDVELWRHADHLVVHGTDAALDASAAAGSPASVIPPDLPHEAPPTRAVARGSLGIDDGTPVALLLGLVRPYKGVGLLADAWPAVRERVPSARLVVAGSVLEQFPDLERLVGQPGVDARIGWLDDEDVLRWAAAADVCLLPYWHGAHSAVLHRAVLAGTPVLASPSLADEVARFAAGPVVPLDAPAWSSAIATALTMPLARPAVPPPGAQAAATIALYRRLLAVSPAT